MGKDCEPDTPKVCKKDKTKEQRILEGAKECKEQMKECVEPVPPTYKEKDYFKLDSKDPTERERAKCLDDCHVKPLLSILRECERRVTAKILYTAEQCHEETVFLVEALDRCVKSRGFATLK